MTRHAEECWVFISPNLYLLHLLPPESLSPLNCPLETKMLLLNSGVRKSSLPFPSWLSGTLCLFRPASSGGGREERNCISSQTELSSNCPFINFMTPSASPWFMPLWRLSQTTAATEPLPAFLFHFQTAAVSWNTAMPLLQREGCRKPSPSSRRFPSPVSRFLSLYLFSQVHPLRSPSSPEMPFP